MDKEKLLYEDHECYRMCCPINAYTFKVNKIRRWLVSQVRSGYALNLYAGKTRLTEINEVRNDCDRENADADYYFNAVDFLKDWKGELFDVVILDPPYSERKSMEYYNGKKNSRFKIVLDHINLVLKVGGKVITFGYHSRVMGKGRGYNVEKVVMFSHGGAHHDTIVSVERRIK